MGPPTVLAVDSIYTPVHPACMQLVFPHGFSYLREWHGNCICNHAVVYFRLFQYLVHNKEILMKPIRVLLAALCAFTSFAHAGVVQLDLAPLYNIDGVANIGDASQSPLDQPNAGGNFVFLTQSLATSRVGASGNGLLDSGLYGADEFHPEMQLGYGLNPNGNNVLQFAGTGPANFTLAAGFYKEIHVAAMTGGGSSFLTLRLNYADGSTTTRTAFVNDWYNDFGSTPDDYYLANGLDRISANLSVYENANDPALFGHRFLVDGSRKLLSFDFVASGTSQFEPRMNIFGAAAVTAAEVPEPGSVALLLIGVLGMAGCRRKKA
ncbi:MAG: Ca2+-binding protein toxin [Massilia sp.]|nr:Ca2+-binding protein toxin [Massilia sp.]